MPAAEVAGLVVGVIALASLFNSCIDLLEFFELGKNHKYDYDTACTKVSLPQERLSDWGRSAHIHDPGHEHPSLREPVKGDLVTRYLRELIKILSNSEGLRQKYDLDPARRTSLGSKPKGHSYPIAHWSFHLRRRTTWSIRDRAKFDRFIDDISFLIEHVERITAPGAGDHMTSRLADSVERDEQTAVRPPRTQTVTSQNRDESLKMQPFRDQSKPDKNQHDSDQNASPQSGHSERAAGSNTASRSASYATAGSKHNEVYGLDQFNVDTEATLQGMLDPSGDLNIVRNSRQVNKGSKGSVQGMASGDAMGINRKQDSQ